MRLKSELFVSAYLRICAASGIAAVLVRRGDGDAGAIYIKVSRLDGTAVLYGPAPAGLDGAETDRRFVACLGTEPRPEADADEHLRREARIDPDFWRVEVEDRAGRHALDDWLVSSRAAL
ncbi:MAG: DUF1491 family protein [Hyphomicrobiaceae bacterium]